MPTKVVMEALSPTMEEGRLVEWKKQEGEPVAVGDVLAEVETDKAVMELVARTGGTMLKHIVEAGATVPVSEPVAVIGQPGEDTGETASRGAGDGQREKGEIGPQSTASKQPSTKQKEATQPTPGQNRPVSMPPAPPAAAATEDRGSAPSRSQGNGAETASTQPATKRVKA